MHDVLEAQFDDVGSKRPGSPPTTARVAATSTIVAQAQNFGLVRWILIFGLVLVGAIMVGTGVSLLNLRDRELAESERGLERLALVLAEQIDRSFQSIELIQTAMIERIQSLGIASAEDYKRQMSGYDTHQRLKDGISALPQINAIVLTDTQGKLINFSRSWPIPSLQVPDDEHIAAFKSDPHLTFWFGKPRLGPATGNWAVPLARKFAGPNGEFLGVVVGIMKLQYFEQIFEAIVPTQNSSISLFRRDGTLLVRYPRQETAIGQSFSNTELFTNVLSQSDHGTIRKIGELSNQEQLISARVLPNFPIIVVATTPVVEALANWNSVVVYVVGVGLALAFATGSIVFIPARKIGLGLRRQNAQFDAALTNMLQGLVMFDKSARIVVCNQRYLEMYNLSADVAKPGCTLRDLLEHRKDVGLYTDDPEQECRRIIDLIARGETATWLIETSDGRSIHTTNRPMPGGGWVNTHEDVTERKKAESTIEESSKNLERAEAMARLGHYKFKQGSTEIRWSENLYRILGLSSESFTPTLSSVMELVHPDDRSLLQQYRRDVMAGLEVPPVVVRCFKNGGQLIYVENWARLLHACDGRPIGMFGTIQDVSERKRSHEALSQAHQSVLEKQYAIDQAVIVGITDVKGKIIHINDKFCHISGYDREELLGNDHRILNSGLHSKEFFRDIYRVIANGQIWRGELCNKAKDGSLYWVDTTIVPQLGPDGKPIAYMACRTDISSRKRAEGALRQTQNFLNAVIENVPVPIIVKEIPNSVQNLRDCRVALINQACEELFGVPRQNIIGKTVDDIYPTNKERADFLVAHESEALQSDQPVVYCDHLIVTPGNGPRIVTEKKVAIRSEDGNSQYLLTVLEDVTERNCAEQHILHMAHYDALTGLPNRLTFNDTIEAAVDRAAKSGEQFTVLSIDLDYFKDANDTYGHIVGDALLREVGKRLQAADEGTFVARIGGDEFMLIVADGAKPAAALAERLIASFVDDFEVEGYQLKLGMSIGGAVYPTDGTDAKTLMINADAALYRAKAEFRGAALFYEAGLGNRLRERLALQEDLRSAIERGELLLHYQPQVQITGEAIGFEALARWQCPKRGMVSPAMFIPIAEESSLIITIGEWVLREACREAASWPQPLTIAINISPIQFRNGNLPNMVHSILLETGLAPSRLELEITEGVLIDDFSRAISILNRLKSLGVRIAMDDFGTGYSSLSYLQAFRYDKIKIDRVFIGGLETDHNSRAIVRAVIGLGQSLKTPIMAEGVETQAQHAFLMEEGCDEIQGYLTGRPMPIADHAKLVGRQPIAQQHYAAAG